MSLKTATTVALVCIVANLVLGLVLRFLMPSIGAAGSVWLRGLLNYAYLMQMLLLNGSLILFFWVLRTRQQ